MTNSMNNINTSFGTKALLVVGAGLVLLFIGMSFPTFASAATYAYVDAQGEVKSVTANDWQTAINTAPNIHIHSGVLLLSSASDFTIVGDNVKAY